MTCTPATWAALRGRPILSFFSYQAITPAMDMRRGPQRMRPWEARLTLSHDSRMPRPRLVGRATAREEHLREATVGDRTPSHRFLRCGTDDVQLGKRLWPFCKNGHNKALHPVDTGLGDWMRTACRTDFRTVLAVVRARLLQDSGAVKAPLGGGPAHLPSGVGEVGGECRLPLITCEERLYGKGSTSPRAA